MLLNCSLFQVGWFSSVLGAAQQLPWLGPAATLLAVAVHLYRAKEPARELTLVAACGFIGALFDSIFVAARWVGYPSGLFNESMAPYWMITMWMLFATTLNVSLRWLKGRYWFAAVLGLVAGPATYYTGEKLGGITFFEPLPALLSLAIGWSLVMPLLIVLAERFDGIGERGERAAGLAARAKQAA